MQPEDLVAADDEGEYAKALSEADATLRLEPENSSVHYLRGQILQHLGRATEAKAEMARAAAIANEARSKRQQELANPDPDLVQQPQPLEILLLHLRRLSQVRETNHSPHAGCPLESCLSRLSINHAPRNLPKNSPLVRFVNSTYRQF